MTHSDIGGGKPSLDRRTLLKTAAAGLAAPVAAGIGRSARAADPVKLTIWQWAPDFDTQIDMFNAANPNVKLVNVNVGGSTAQNIKVRNVLQARSGGPDLIMQNYAQVKTFGNIGAFLDVAPTLGALRPKYTAYSWHEVSDGNKLWGLPIDSAPMIQLYRADILEKNGIEVPKTWDDFAAAGEKLRTKSPGTFITDGVFNRPDWINALLWQAGWKGFEYSGDRISIQINGPAARKFADYWQRLLKDGLIEAKPGMTTDFFYGLDDGRYATILGGSWFPNYLRPSARKSAGLWRVAQMPQFAAGQKNITAWGGAMVGVFSGTKYPKEATAALAWLLDNTEVGKVYNKKQFLTPTLDSLLEDAALEAEPSDFCGGQKINEIVFASARAMSSDFRWSPFQDYVYDTMSDELASAGTGKRPIMEAFDRMQDRLVAFAKEQGFTVVT